MGGPHEQHRIRGQHRNTGSDRNGTGKPLHPVVVLQGDLLQEASDSRFAIPDRLLQGRQLSRLRQVLAHLG